MWADIFTTVVCIPFVIRFLRSIPKEDRETVIDRLYREKIKH